MTNRVVVPRSGSKWAMDLDVPSALSVVPCVASGAGIVPKLVQQALENGPSDTACGAKAVDATPAYEEGNRMEILVKGMAQLLEAFGPWVAREDEKAYRLMGAVEL